MLPSEMSKKGECFVTANNQEIANEGQVTFPTYSKELVRTDQTWQVADIAKPLLSVGEECDKNQWAVFTKTGGFFYSLETGQVRHFDRNTNGAYVQEMWVPPPIGESPQVPVSGFPWPGR